VCKSLYESVRMRRGVCLRVCVCVCEYEMSVCACVRVSIGV
jgi:hypothetical protein